MQRVAARPDARCDRVRRASTAARRAETRCDDVASRRARRPAPGPCGRRAALAGIRRLGVEEPRQRLAQVRAREPDRRGAPGQPRQHGRLDQALQVDRRVVAASRRSAPDRRRAAPSVGPRGSSGITRSTTVTSSTQLDVARVDQPVDRARQDSARERGGGRDRVDRRRPASPGGRSGIAGRRTRSSTTAHARGPIRASRSRVEWSLGSPTMAVRPP